jgi:hypothetical protein
MKRGFLVTDAGQRIPYWVTEAQAERIAAEEGGTKDRFVMALRGYGVMQPINWRFVESAIPPGRKQWRTYHNGSLDPDYGIE